MLDRCETFRDCRTTISLSSLKISTLYTIHCGFYRCSNTQNLIMMCELEGSATQQNCVQDYVIFTRLHQVCTGITHICSSSIQQITEECGYVLRLQIKNYKRLHRDYRASVQDYSHIVDPSCELCTFSQIWSHICMQERDTPTHQCQDPDITKWLSLLTTTAFYSLVKYHKTPLS